MTGSPKNDAQRDYGVNALPGETLGRVMNRRWACGCAVTQHVERGRFTFASCDERKCPNAERVAFGVRDADQKANAELCAVHGTKGCDCL